MMGSQRAARRRRALAGGALLLLAVAAPLAAHAHGRSISHSSWRLDERGATVQARITALDATLLPPEGSPEATLGRYAADSLILTADGTPCTVTSPPRALAAPRGWHVLEWRVDCPPGTRALASTLFLDVAPSHLHFARVRTADGTVLERVLGAEDPPWQLEAAGARPAAAGGFWSYVLLGIEHIVSGWDHLAFVAALLLLARSLREVAMLVSAFTLAHSVTLALAVLGLVRPEAAAVEALIGFSIALVAAENTWLLGGQDRAIPLCTVGLLLVLAVAAALHVGALRPLALIGLGVFSLCHFALLERAPRPAPVRAAVAFGFGLVHGFGFAGVLAEMELPRERLAAALGGFNLGVELGQLAVVLVLWPLLRRVGRLDQGRMEARVAAAGSAAICGLGLFWFLTRALG